MSVSCAEEKTNGDMSKPWCSTSNRVKRHVNPVDTTTKESRFVANPGVLITGLILPFTN